jgi:hydrogenase maturation factor
MPTVFTSNFVGFTKIKGKSKMKPLVMCENGGCLAKVGGSELTRLIGELFGEFAPEDSSLFTIDGADMLFNLDFGPLIGDDAYEAGKISAHHSISDIYVSAGTPMYASIMLQIAQDITYGQTKQILA